jgi:hypothetical protein
MKRLILAAALALLVLPLALAGPALANHCGDTKSVVGGNYTLNEGDTLDANLVVLGGNAVIAAGAKVNCTVVVLGGNVDIAGTVEEDVVIFGGNARLGSTAVVEGELVAFGGATTREEGAQVRGGESQGFEFNRDLPLPRVPDRFWFFRPVLSFYGSVFDVVFSSVALGLLALLVVLFWPDQTARVSAAITSAPAAAGGLGLLTAIAVPVLIVLMALTLCLIPLSFVGALLLVAAVVFGWLALGMLVGARLAAALNWHTLHPAVSAAFGAFLLTVVARFIDMAVPCLGWMAPLLLGAVGLGAVALTRFGTRPYLPSLPASPPAQPTPPPASDAGGAAAAS